MGQLKRYKEAPEGLQKLVITQLEPNRYRAQLMERKNAGETWRDVWKIDGTRERVGRMLEGVNFL